jgi:hypothetical protein
MTDHLHKIKNIKRRYEKEWLRQEGILAVGIGQIDDKIGIIVSVDGKMVRESFKLPEEIEGVPVKINDTGLLKIF